MEKGCVMPIYEFKCPKCGLVTEEIVLMSMDKIACARPGCSGIAKVRISKNTFHLKGSGWTPKFKKD